MTDLEIVRDAHAYAKELIKKISEDKVHMMDSSDGAAWATILTMEMGRLLAVSFVASFGAFSAYDVFMEGLRDAAHQHLTSHIIRQESAQQARNAMSKIDTGNSQERPS